MACGELSDGTVLVLLGNRQAGDLYTVCDGKLRRVAHEDAEVMTGVPYLHRARRAARRTWQDIDIGAPVSSDPDKGDHE